MMLHTLLLTVLVVGAVHAQDYCSICPDHIMCKYQGVGRKCSKILASGLSEADKDVIIDKHNELRNKVALGKETQGSNGAQPPAANMMKVSWDSELATIAQRWADQCGDFNYNCRNVERFSVGENIYGNSDLCKDDWDPKINYSAAVQSWYDQVSRCDKDAISPYRILLEEDDEEERQDQRYTQVAWADTTSIGCGYKSFEFKRICHKFLVCYYGPAGNVDGATMYEEGSARSACPDSPSDSLYPGLCGETTQS